MKEAGFIYEDHTADVQARCWGKSLEEAFNQTAYSLMATITPDLKKISPKVEKKIKIEAEDKEALLFDFLSELLYIFDVEELVFNNIKVQIIKESEDLYVLNALLSGEKFDISKHEIGVEVKAITYSFMEITESKNRVEISIVFDI
ncbi:MAG: archease [Promethearchaeota archaeon]